jgi:hypothetical protein
VASEQLLAGLRGRTNSITTFFAELFAIVSAMVVYFLIRGELPEPAAEAVVRAGGVIRLEQALGIFSERQWQQPLLDRHLLMQLANGIYVYGHLPVLAATGFWLYFRRRSGYRLFRNALLISAGIGLIGYALFPVAPPRLLPEWGFVDTVAVLARDTYEMQPGPFVNHFAAVPSFHFGWMLLAGILVWRNTGSLWPKLLVVVLTVATFWATAVTGNHFFFDMVVGGLVVVLALYIADLIGRGRLSPGRALRAVRERFAS